MKTYHGMMEAAIQPKANPVRHPAPFYRGLRLCAINGSTFSFANTPQAKKRMNKARSRRG
ncbi:MAG: hypothetical protein KA118_03775 [Verrucomicrobia bacterium]|nr:hypothetical protein [Verrucomicrobiota bacterium]